MIEHELKCWPEFFNAVEAGYKRCDIRKEDRNFQIGDVIVLQEFRPCSQCDGSGWEKVAWVEIDPINSREIESYLYPCSCRDPHGEYTGRKLKVEITHISRFTMPSGLVVLSIRKLEAD